MRHPGECATPGRHTALPKFRQEPHGFKMEKQGKFPTGDEPSVGTPDEKRASGPQDPDALYQVHFVARK